MEALYLHIPFCNHICHYCDFVKMVASDDRKNQYVDVLLAEFAAYKDEYNNIKTIYIGGGTPTSLSIEHLEQVLKTINTTINMKQVVEFTIESNVETLTEAKIALLKKYNVSRISLGVQTFSESLLAIIDRKHYYEDVIRVIANLKQAGISNINVDMMFAIPTQTIEMLEVDLAILKTLDVEHISYYSLILEEKTVFNYLHTKGKLDLIDEDLEAQMYEVVIANLSQMAYTHYEISNFAKSKPSLHNLTYWLNNEYIGIGLGAHGYIKGERYANTANMTQYLNKEFISEALVLTNDEKMSEELILGLRLRIGVSLKRFLKRYGVTVFEVFPFVDEQIAKGYLEIIDNHLHLTNRALFLGNEIFELFLNVGA